MTRRWGPLALALLAAMGAASASDAAPWPTPARPGAQVFRYEGQEASPDRSRAIGPTSAYGPTTAAA